MANLRLTFTDPATRRTVTLDAQRTREPSAASDGFVDLGLDGFDGAVRIPSSALSAQDSEALRRALANPEVAGLKVSDRLAGATAAVMAYNAALCDRITSRTARTTGRAYGVVISSSACSSSHLRSAASAIVFNAF